MHRETLASLSFMKNHSPRICIPVCERRASDLPAALARAAEHGDSIEIRLDYLNASELAQALPQLPTLLAGLPRPVILTLRSREQGGARETTFAEVERFLLCQIRGTDFLDVELDAVEQARGLAIDWSKAICSHHDFGMPFGDVNAIYDRLAQTSARVLKIAVRAERITDCLPIFRVLRRARDEQRELIAIAMDEAGLLTRVLATSRGAFLTFGALDAEHRSAPGQVTAKELRELYHLDAINAETPVMGLIGSPVSHSVSPHMHNAGYAACRLSGVYLPLQVSKLEDFMRRMVRPATREFDWPLRGLSVTAPHKTEVINYLDVIDEAARAIGAVNTISIEDEQLVGRNTDAEAAIAPLRPLIELRNAKVAVIGAGGAARAVLWQLRRDEAKSTIFARDRTRAADTAHMFDADCQSLQSATFEDYDVVINTTPLGTAGGPRAGETPATAAALRPEQIAYDLVYNPLQTPFLREAQAAGCRALLGGLDMLVLQAAQQFRLWMGVDAPLDIMRNAALTQIKR
ncbi:MAG: shikimate dehydrogenase [Pyrinomonadaceae bacterium]